MKLKAPAQGIEQRGNLAREFRTFPVRPVELREGSGKPPVFVGDASMVDTPYSVTDKYGTFTETIMRGAFDKTLKDGADVRLLIDHSGLPLARTKSGTLKLAATPHLHAEATLDPANPRVQELQSVMRRGDVDQMSIGFRAVRDEWNEDYTERKVHEAALFDVSAVVDPASTSTSASLRASYTPTLGIDRVHLSGMDTDNEAGAGGSHVGDLPPGGNLTMTGSTDPNMPGTDMTSTASTGLGTYAELPIAGQSLGTNSTGAGSQAQMALGQTSGGATAGTTLATGGYIATTGAGGPSALGNDTPGMSSPQDVLSAAGAIMLLKAVNAPQVLLDAITSAYRAKGRNYGLRASSVAMEPDPSPLLLRLDALVDQVDDVVDSLLVAYGLQDADVENDADDSGSGAMPGSKMTAGSGAAGTYNSLMTLWEKRIPAHS